MPVYAVHYTYDARAEERAAVRPVHREFLQSLADRGVVLARGPYNEPDDPGALLVLRGESAEEIAGHLDQDPFFLEGFLTDRRIREWTQVGGPFGD